MPCYSPIRAWKSKTPNSTGKRSLVFQRAQAQFSDTPIEIPCRKCIGCRLAYSQEWGIRAFHESTLYENNCFLTLTYNDDHLPANGSLDPQHMTKFMKDLRYLEGSDIRFLLCGEYGDNLDRPHYHACIFNYDFPDRVPHTKNRENMLYTSEKLTKLWPYGFSLVGDLTFGSAAYVARYVMKKITGEPAEDHYQGKKPEFLRMSLRPGLGKGWYDKYKKDLYPHDFTIMNGKKMPVPAYYDKLLLEENPELHSQVLSRRRTYANKKPEEQTGTRLFTRETCKLEQAKSLTRTI